MRLPRKTALPLAAALIPLGLMVVASSGMATHARPTAATPLRAPLVTAMKPCTAPTGDPAGLTHGGTLSFPSCQVGGAGTVAGPNSSNISFGSPGSVAPAPTQGSGYVLICTTTGCGTPPTLPGGGGNWKIESVITDVRCTGSTACAPVGCGPGGSCNGTQTTQDYIGGVRFTATLQITDHNNGSPTYTTSATMVATPFPADGACAFNTSGGAGIGGTCTINTTALTVCPSCFTPGKLANVELGQITILDGGIDGDVGTFPADNLVAFKQGFLVP